MYNPIEAKRRFVESQIQKSFDSGINVAEEIDLEKAHNDGDHHPTKPWVWVSSANGGKGDWRVEGGRAHKKAGASTTQVSMSDIASKINANIDSVLKVAGVDSYSNVIDVKATDSSVIIRYNDDGGHLHTLPLTKSVAQSVLKEVDKQKMQSRKKNNNGGSLSFSDFKLLPLGTVVSGGGYELKKDGKNRWVSLSNGKSNGATKNDEDAFRLQEFDDFNLDRNKNSTPSHRKPGSTDEIERMTAQGVRSSILGLNNIATNVKDNGDHFKIDFDANDFNTNGKRSPQIDRIAKFLESMGASCVIGSNSIKAYKKVDAKKHSDIDIKEFVPKKIF